MNPTNENALALGDADRLPANLNAIQAYSQYKVPLLHQAMGGVI
jgi:hypothetical protein